MNHMPYYNVSLPAKATAIIHDDLEWSTPATIASKVQMMCPSVSEQQVDFAWSQMSEILWKRETEQLPSVKTLLVNSKKLTLMRLEIVW